jgi:hypothetical protein
VKTYNFVLSVKERKDEFWESDPTPGIIEMWIKEILRLGDMLEGFDYDLEFIGKETQDE